MNISEFVAKWRRVELTERSASQQHFLDLCEVLDHPKPALADPTGEEFTFERGAAKHGGGQGCEFARTLATPLVAKHHAMRWIDCEPSITDEEILARLLALNHERAQQ